MHYRDAGEATARPDDRAVGHRHGRAEGDAIFGVSGVSTRRQHAGECPNPSAAPRRLVMVMMKAMAMLLREHPTRYHLS